MIKKILFFILLTQQVIFTQNNNELFSDANRLYKEGKYTEAIEVYKKIEASQLVSSELFYNLGNAYYKLNKVAPCIFYYEKALKLNPTNEDAKNNLIFAKKLTLDRIEELPKSFLQRIDKLILKRLSYNSWGILSIVLSLTVTLLFISFYISITPNKKRLFLTGSFISFVCMVFSFFFAFNQYNKVKKNRQAIIFTEEVNIKNAPTENSENVFTLHEGTKVKILDEVDGWKKIKLSDGKLGWLHQKNLQEL